MHAASLLHTDVWTGSVLFDTAGTWHLADCGPMWSLASQSDELHEVICLLIQYGAQLVIVTGVLRSYVCRLLTYKSSHVHIEHTLSACMHQQTYPISDLLM